MSVTEYLGTVLNAVNRALQYKLFELNQTPITLSSIIMFFVVVASFYLIARLLDRGLIRRVLPRFQITLATQYTLGRITHYLVMIVGSLVAFQFVGIDLSSLAVIFGLLSVGVGFGLQNVTSNFVAGLILLFERPIRVGDRITVGETEGDVLAIKMRSTTIRSLNNISIIVPNSEFVSANVINWSHGDPKIRLVIEVGVSYASDLDLVIRALKEVAIDNPAVLAQPEPEVLLTGFADSAWDMALRLWISNPQGHHVIRSEINCAIVRKFREYKIEIPFPQRDLHVRSSVDLPVTAPSQE